MGYRIGNTSLENRADSLSDLMSRLDIDIIDDLVNEVSTLEIRLADTVDEYDEQVNDLESQIIDLSAEIALLTRKLADSIKEQSQLLELINTLRT